MTSVLSLGHAEIYNALPNVEEADQDRQSRTEFDKFLDDFAEILVEAELHKAGLDKIAGPLLLHSHFSVNDDTAIVERPELLDDGRPALVARPEAVTPEAVAVRWKWQPETAQFHPLEYCTDPVAVSSAHKLAQHTDFLSRVGQLLESYRLHDVIGLTVLPRSLEVKEAGLVYFERSSDDVSVTTVETSSLPGIITAWSATISSDGVRIRPQTRCDLTTRFCGSCKCLRTTCVSDPL
ncbi:hypothetical protein LAUMK191_01522 [Mycobacterium attenuatum]|uniref:Uncharacterized protein n=1 Tax=Mycobacterium attenuatum TaxID=2341086 RepID=A0A498PX67_9MYCO|nr:hypothetical protein LAUMK136_01530 [Mycobacterium attenuatum]VBA49270.1 hypothetical protein LAUMK191_01522 [Mycobacterium attenuatum]VBA54878.1 hypothetical protein LAUMK41_01594 [Mycobacterium attenuatum]